MGRRKEVQPVKSAARGFGGSAAGGFGGGAAGAFGGGAAGAFGGAHPLARGFGDDVVDPLTAELQQHLKRLAKKDATTKRKALSELGELVGGPADDDAVTRTIIALPQWCYMYSKLTNDATVQVREAAHKLMGQVALVVKEELEPHVAAVLPRWWIAQFDPRAEARRAAESALRAAFPGRRINKALRLCHKPLFAELKEVFESSPQSVVDIKAVEGIHVAKEMYERQVHCGLLALGAFVERLVEVEKFDDGLRAGVADLLEPAAFWKLGSSKFGEIRLGFFRLLPLLCQHMAKAVGDHLANVAPIVLGAMSDQVASNYSAIWPAILHLAKAFPSAWAHVDARKVVLPRMWACLRAGAYGSWAETCPAVLPWVSVLPASLLSPELGAQLCSALWHPVSSRTVPSSSASAVAFAWAECAAHLITAGAAVVSERAASGEGALSAADVEAWSALPNPRKPQAKPTAEEIAELKEAKQARSSFLTTVAARLGGEWTPKMVEKELARLKTRGPEEPEPEPEPDVDATELFYRECLLKPALVVLFEDQVHVAECLAAAVAKQATIRPALTSQHVECLFEAITAAVAERVVAPDAQAASSCIRWFVPFIQSFDRTCREVSLEPTVGMRTAQAVTRTVLDRADGELPRAVSLQLFAELASAPLSFAYAMPMAERSTAMREKLVPWLNTAHAGTAERASITKLLSAYLNSIDDPTQAAREWDECISGVLNGGTAPLLGLLQSATREGAGHDGVPVGLPTLNGLAASESYRQQMFDEVDGEAVRKLLLLGLVNSGSGSTPLFSPNFAIQLVEWLADSVEAHSSESGAAVQDLCRLIDGALAADPPASPEWAQLHATRERLLTRIFVLQVPAKCSTGDLLLNTSDLCAARCSELWNRHSSILLDVATGAGDSATASCAWIDAAPALVEQLLTIALCPDLTANSAEQGEEHVLAMCVKLASELLATSSCASPQCLQDTLRRMLASIVPILTSRRESTTNVAWAKPFSRALGFAVGLARTVRPVDLYLGSADEDRRRLFLELFLYGGLEPVRTSGPACLQSAVVDARLLAECELREFWTACCQGTLSSQEAEQASIGADRYALQSVHMAVELSAAEERFDGILATLFPDVEAGQQRAALSGSLVALLDEAVVSPAERILLVDDPAGLDGKSVHAAADVVYGLLPYLPRSRGWSVVETCNDRLRDDFPDVAAAETLQSAMLLITGRGVSTIVRESTGHCTVGMPSAAYEEAESARQQRLEEFSAGSDSSGDDNFYDASDVELGDNAPDEAAIKIVVRSALTYLRLGFSASTTGLMSTSNSTLRWLGLVEVMRAAVATGVLADSAESAEECTFSEWEFCVSNAIKAATLPSDAAHGEWQTRVHRAALELMGEMLSKLQRASSVLTAQAEVFEDALTGAAYSQLVDEDAQWSPAVWRVLVALLPAWQSPERTIMLGYTDELVQQLANPLYSVRAEVYQLFVKLCDAALKDLKTMNGQRDEAAADADGADGEGREDDPFSAEFNAPGRPDILPAALWDLVLGDVPEQSSLLTTPAYLFGWALVIQSVADAPAALRSEIVDVVTTDTKVDGVTFAGSAATRLLSALVSLLPLDAAGGRKALGKIPPLSVIRDGGSAAEVAAALFGRVLRQVRRTCSFHCLAAQLLIRGCPSCQQCLGNGSTLFLALNTPTSRNMQLRWCVASPPDCGFVAWPQMTNAPSSLGHAYYREVRAGSNERGRD